MDGGLEKERKMDGGFDCMLYFWPTKNPLVRPNGSRRQGRVYDLADEFSGSSHHSLSRCSRTCGWG